jgi:hypothetical protein
MPLSKLEQANHIIEMRRIKASIARKCRHCDRPIKPCYCKDPNCKGFYHSPAEANTEHWPEPAI